VRAGNGGQHAGEYALAFALRPRRRAPIPGSEVEQTAAKLGVQTAIEDSHWDFAGQTASITSFVAKQVQGILVDNCLPSFTDRPIQAAANAGIPVVTVGDVRPGSDNFLVHVGFDNLQAGRDAAQFIIDKLGNRGAVIEIEGWRQWPSSDSRKAGFDEVITKSKVKLLDSVAQTGTGMQERGSWQGSSRSTRSSTRSSLPTTR
jgi:ABC-type sugar transport system substrate-binding protein